MVGAAGKGEGGAGAGGGLIETWKTIQNELELLLHAWLERYANDIYCVYVWPILIFGGGWRCGRGEGRGGWGRRGGGVVKGGGEGGWEGNIVPAWLIFM